MTDESPFRRLRLLAGIRQQDLVEKSGVSITAVVQVEQGRYAQVPHRLNMTLARACRDAGVHALSILVTEYGDASLDGAMRNWQRRQRQQLDMSKLGPLTLEELIDLFGNADRFSKDLCLPVATLHNFRTGKFRWLPVVIREALDEAGYRFTEQLDTDKWQPTQ